MLRVITLCGLMALTIPAAAAETADHPLIAGTGQIAMATPAPVLKSTVTVTDDLIYIGDMVENAGPLSHIAIFRAPDPGSTGSVPTRSVLDALYPYGLGNISTHGVSEVSVTRASRNLTAEEVESSIRHALAERLEVKNPADLSLALDQTLRTIRLEPAATGALQVVRLDYDRSRRRFDIIFDLVGSDILKRMPLHLTGSFTETGNVVSLTRSLQRGEVIGPADLTVERRPRATISRDDVVQIGQAIGLAARQPLRAGQALRETDLMRPKLVQRNEGVTLLYQIPGIMLTVRGKALEAGAEGDVVSVLNLQSKRTIEGTVVAPGRVRVAAVGARLASIASARMQARATQPLSSK